MVVRGGLMSWFVVVRSGCGGLMSWFVVVCSGLMSWFVVVRSGLMSWFVVVCGGLMSWFVVVQYLPDNLKIGVVSLKSQLQLIWWSVAVRGGLILLCHLVLNLMKTSAASSNKFKNKLKNEIFF